MTDSEIFEKLYNGGLFNLPLLIKFTHSTAGVVRLTNDNVKITYKGEEYLPATFDYYQPDSNGEGASLNISSKPGENELFEFIENADENYVLEVIATIQDEEIQEFRNYKHFHGTADVDEKGNITFNFESDDRQEMTFTPYTYDTDNNKGNA